MINRIAEKTNLSKKDAAAVMAALLSTITETLKAEGKQAIPNFGTFEIKEHAARTGKNPRTGETMQIPAKRIPAFKPVKALKEAIDK